MGELANWLVYQMRKANAFKYFIDDAVGLAVLVAAACGKPNILAHVEAVEHARHLGLYTDATARDLMGVQARYVIATIKYTPGGRLILVGEAAEEGRFACAIRAYQAAQLAFGHAEVDIINRYYASKTHGQATRLQDRWTAISHC